jgi:hypothetical protein
MCERRRGDRARPLAVTAFLAVITIACGVYAASKLGINSDTKSLVSDNLPFRVRQRDLESTFHTLEGAVLVVVDADSPLRAARAADDLAARLAVRRDLFEDVTVPGGGPFFRKNALLYLDIDDLEDLTDRLSAVQPFMAELARDQSLVGVAKLLRKALESEREGRDTGFDVSTALDRVSDGVEAAATGKRALDPWSSALLGTSMPEESRRRVIVVRTHFDFSDLFKAGPAVQVIRTSAAELKLDPEHGVRVRVPATRSSTTRSCSRCGRRRFALRSSRSFCSRAPSASRCARCASWSRSLRACSRACCGATRSRPRGWDSSTRSPPRSTC